MKRNYLLATLFVGTLLSIGVVAVVRDNAYKKQRALQAVNQSPRYSPLGPPLHSMRTGKFHNGEVAIGQLRIEFETEPPVIEANRPVHLKWTIKEKNSAQEAPIDRSIHNSPIHVYLIQSDLKQNLIHVHPAQSSQNKQVWESIVSFPSSGLWNIFFETASKGVFYQLSSSLNIPETENAEDVLDFSLRKLSRDWEIVLKPSKDSISFGEPIRLIFEVVSRTSGAAPPREDYYLVNQHNIMFALRGYSLFWNAHGDGSVNAFSGQNGIEVTRLPMNETPFGYLVVFPRPGIWMIRFEMIGVETDFLLRVN